MPLDRQKLNHLSTHARLGEQLSSVAVIAYELGRTKASEDMVRTLQDLLEKMDLLVEELLAP